MREHYHALIGNPAGIEKLLRAGAEKARAVATPFMGELRQAVGLRNLGSQTGASSQIKAVKAASPAFKQYREKDGKFYFKLLDADAQLLLQSEGFDSPRDAAEVISALQKNGMAAVGAQGAKIRVIEGISPETLRTALKSFTPA